MSLTTLYGDELTLPRTLRDKYHLTAGVSVRIIETSDGILLIPLTEEPMSAELQEELSDWQTLGESVVTSFPYEETTQEEGTAKPFTLRRSFSGTETAPPSRPGYE